MKDYIVDQIRNSKSQMITYADYISMALYNPKVGYYMKNKKKLGPEGDFYTSSGVHAVFGKAFAHFFLDIIEKEKLPSHICEFGGGDGRFAKAVIDEWELIAPDKKLLYTIIEMSPYHRDEQKELLAEKAGFCQLESLQAYEKEYGANFEGIIFSNELLDALPVHVIEKQRTDIYEVFVSEVDGELVEKTELCSNKAILNWLEKYGPPLNEGQRIEVPLYMGKWIEEINAFLKRGLLVTIDYGFTKEEWTMPERKDGSLRGYYKHQLINNPLEHPTEMDLTTHIHLDAYEMMTKENQLEKIIDLKQNRFLLMIGIFKFLQENYDPNPFSKKSKQNRAIRTLISDSGMSVAFHVFLHGKKLSNASSYRFLTDDPYKV